MKDFGTPPKSVILSQWDVIINICQVIYRIRLIYQGVIQTFKIANSQWNININIKAAAEQKKRNQFKELTESLTSIFEEFNALVLPHPTTDIKSFI